VRLFPDAEERRKKIVIRKGRENYLCLLNLEDALQGGFAGRAAILAQLVARWAAYSKDGDMIGGDLPGWLPSLFRRAGATALTDRRGECVYAGCPHYRRCFIERAARASQDADLVIANHALVMVNAARGRALAMGAASRRRGSCSTRAIICSTPPIRPSPPPSPARRRSSCAAGSSGRRAARAGGGAASRRG
jgi:ATP-dependent DNA helicase DinG